MGTTDACNEHSVKKLGKRQTCVSKHIESVQWKVRATASTVAAVVHKKTCETTPVAYVETLPVPIIVAAAATTTTPTIGPTAATRGIASFIFFSSIASAAATALAPTLLHFIAGRGRFGVELLAEQVEKRGLLRATRKERIWVERAVGHHVFGQKYGPDNRGISWNNAHEGRQHMKGLGEKTTPAQHIRSSPRLCNTFIHLRGFCRSLMRGPLSDSDRTLAEGTTGPPPQSRRPRRPRDPGLAPQPAQHCEQRQDHARRRARVVRLQSRRPRRPPATSATLRTTARPRSPTRSCRAPAISAPSARGDSTTRIHNTHGCTHLNCSFSTLVAGISSNFFVFALTSATYTASAMFILPRGRTGSESVPRDRTFGRMGF